MERKSVKIQYKKSRNVFLDKKIHESSKAVREMQKGISQMGRNCSCLFFPEVRELVCTVKHYL
jgi:hypothetical protein